MFLGIDIGGTKTLIALFDSRGRITYESRFDTPDSPGIFLKTLISELQPIIYEKIVHAVVAVPAIVEKSGSCSPQNLPNWHHINVQPTIKKLFNCPVDVLNDADLATIYESRRIHGKSIYLTFSTGIGGGIAVNGKLTPESATFEPGHWLYEYSDGKYEWEDLASAKSLRQKFDRKVSELKSKNQLETTAHLMSFGLNSIVAQYRPSTIIIGGPLAYIIKDLRPYLYPYLNVKKFSLRIIPARRPEKSVIYGCFHYAKTKH